MNPVAFIKQKGKRKKCEGEYVASGRHGGCLFYIMKLLK